jgi:hypothetical protein
LPLWLKPRRAPVGDTEFARELADLAPNRLRFLGQVLEEMPSRPGAQRRFVQMPVAPASRAARTTSRSCSGRSEIPGGIDGLAKLSREVALLNHLDKGCKRGGPAE